MSKFTVPDRFSDPCGDPAGDPSAAVLWVACLCAEWCGACRDYRALFEQVSRAHPALRFAWVDIEDHADLADDFDVETFPTILVTGEQGTRFLGPMLPHAETLARMLTALPDAQPLDEKVRTLLDALVQTPEMFLIDTVSRVLFRALK